MNIVLKNLDEGLVRRVKIAAATEVMTIKDWCVRAIEVGLEGKVAPVKELVARVGKDGKGLEVARAVAARKKEVYCPGCGVPVGREHNPNMCGKKGVFGGD